ncbi:MAG: hypothetical protein CMO80_12810 [Verrucomicrobiales bacterium]|nr:hypothetical protein [Verrucomicrobiales bacterium]|tara:strand:+ start:1684 stop:2232 length:549 start_codon:yes stop_codon:yes gene_type:complete
MVSKFVFNLQSHDNRRDLPSKILIVQRSDEELEVVLIRLFAYLIFYRDRLQMEVDLHDDYIRFVPDLVQLDYQLQPALWVECAECTPTKLNKLAVKAHEAEIWAVKKSESEVEELRTQMTKAKCRTDRYGLMSLDEVVFGDVSRATKARNDVALYVCDFEDGVLQFDYNGIWHDMTFRSSRF